MCSGLGDIMSVLGHNRYLSVVGCCKNKYNSILKIQIR